MDDTTPVGELRRWVREFVAEREWEAFHAPKNLAMSLAIEAAELMEHFQWLSVEGSREVAVDRARRQAAGEELADVVCYALALAETLSLDVTTAVREKMAKNRAKYPAEEFRGRYGTEDRGGKLPGESDTG